MVSFFFNRSTFRDRLRTIVIELRPSFVIFWFNRMIIAAKILRAFTNQFSNCDIIIWLWKLQAMTIYCFFPKHEKKYKHQFKSNAHAATCTNTLNFTSARQNKSVLYTSIVLLTVNGLTLHVRTRHEYAKSGHL